jgi:hypothetical protein
MNEPQRVQAHRILVLAFDGGDRPMACVATGLHVIVQAKPGMPSLRLSHHVIILRMASIAAGYQRHL